MAGDLPGHEALQLDRSASVRTARPVDAAFDFDQLDSAEAAAAVASGCGATAPVQPPRPAAVEAPAPLARHELAGLGAAGNAAGEGIALLSNGSRGDVQPMIAVAHALARRGYRVRIFTNVNLVEFCLTNGIDAVAVFPDTRAVIESIGGMRGTSCEGLQRGREAVVRWLEKHPGECTEPAAALAAFRPAALLATPMASDAAWRYEKVGGVPTMCVYFSREALDIYEGLLDLRPPRPHIYAVSTVLDSAPLPSHVLGELHQTGELLFEERPSGPELAPGMPLARLRDFLAAGPPPILLGWGSMIAEGLPPSAMLRLALRAAQRAQPGGRRAVVLGGWAQLDELGAKLLEGTLPDPEEGDEDLAEFARRHIHFVSAVPHAWVLPRCCCAVHHGGLGTTQAVLRAGIPAVVTPIFGDQFANAAAVEDVGAGYGFKVRLAEIDADALAGAIATCISGPRAAALRNGARKAAFQLQAESGSHKAARIVTEFLRDWKAAPKLVRPVH